MSKLELVPKPDWERGTVPFCCEDCAKLGQSPTVLKPALDIIGFPDANPCQGETTLYLPTKIKNQFWAMTHVWRLVN
jgi:hypothetical protein